MEHLLDPIYIGLHIINLIVMVLVLKKLVYKPMSNFMQARRDAVAQEIKQADDARIAAEELSQRVEKEKLELEQRTRNESYAILSEAHAKAESIISAANKDAQEITEQARLEAQREYEAVQEEQRQNAAALAVDIAAAVLPEALTKEQQQALLNASVEEAMKYEL